MFADLVAFLRAQPRVSIRAEDPAQLSLDAIERSAVFRFADDISVRCVPISDALSTIAVYSRSRVGRYDFGVNAARVDRWLRALGAQD